MTAREPIVTDHAVVRYLERVHGLDVAAVREHIAGRAATAVELGAIAVQIEGVRMHLADVTVVTVTPIRRRKRKADRRDLREAP
ncbi:hypothetical protein HDIA_2253 [Hartmannibacter diazotrophicus]|uniref:Uncharacterized protein n=1 Tax=Hartmannibacter diazotrophicus TaxID=1482074 RepID=A0A2C9D648_9HYPH|nr:hypothetical protein [Hartmannibacter diazotrophicus]SON55794.1 hypothetical protein HDIA_2253 [Hartmannibacter diazotrophicus]